MTLEQAIDLAAEWWVKMIYNGVWDDGDMASEVIHSWAKSFAAPLREEYRTKLKAGFVQLLKHPDNRRELYSDYGNSFIDDMFKAAGLDLRSNIHCPQKAGTFIEQRGDDYIVQVKSGYGKPLERIYPW